MHIVPTILEKTSNKEYAFDLYSRLLKDRIVFLSGEINDQVATLIISELLYLDAQNNNDIFLYINSPGGSVTAGLAIYDTMNYIKSDVKTIGIGLCASMGAFLLATGAPGKRMCLPNTEIMIHQPLGGAEGQASDIKIAAERILKTKDKINNLLSKVTNQSIKKISKDTDRDNFFSAMEAKQYGLIDNIL